MAEDVKVPEGWDVSNLGKLASFINGYAFKPEDWKEEGLPIIRIEQLKDPNAKYDYSDKKLPDIYLIDNGDLIFSWSATLAIKLWDRGKAYLNQHLYKVIPNSTIKRRFLKYLLEHKIEDLSKETHGSTMKHITRTFLLNFRVTYPKSKLEQYKIAEILETVDNAIEKTDRIIEKYKRIKQGLMQDLLTRGIAESDELGVMSYELRDEKKHRFKDSPLGRIPEEWKVVELGEVADVRGGKRLPKGEDFAASQTLFPYIRLVDIKGMNINLSAVKYIQEKTWKRIRRYTISKDDIMLSIAGTIGLVALIPEALDGANLTENAAKLTTLRYFGKRFLAYYLTFHKAQRQIETLMGIVAQPKLALFRIKQLKIPLPPLPEQHRIASILSQIDEAIEKEQKYKEKLERIKRGLMEDLLTGNVRVNHLIEKVEA